jgi:hypothetical protein
MEFQLTIAATVGEKFRLVDRSRRTPLKWAIDWVDCDVRGLPHRQGTGVIEPLRSDSGAIIDEIIDPRRDAEINQPLPGSIPGFTLSINLVTAEFVAPGFDPNERWGEGFLEHGIFESEVTSDTWKKLRAFASRLLDEGIERMRTQFKEQLPAGNTTRPRGRNAESESLKTLCRYLLGATHTVLDDPGPTGFRSVNDICKEMGIRWPRRPEK